MNSPVDRVTPILTVATKVKRKVIIHTEAIFKIKIKIATSAGQNLFFEVTSNLENILE